MTSFQETFDKLTDGVPSKSEHYYPGLYLSDKAADLFAGRAVGDEVEMVTKVRIRSMSIRQDKDGKEHNVSLDILEGELTEEPAAAESTLFDAKL